MAGKSKGKRVNVSSTKEITLPQGPLYGCKAESLDESLYIFVVNTEVYVLRESVHDYSLKGLSYTCNDTDHAVNYAQQIRNKREEAGIEFYEWGQTVLGSPTERSCGVFIAMLDKNHTGVNLKQLVISGSVAMDSSTEALLNALDMSGTNPASAGVTASEPVPDSRSGLSPLEPHMNPDQYLKELMGR